MELEDISYSKYYLRSTNRKVSTSKLNESNLSNNNISKCLNLSNLTNSYISNNTVVFNKNQSINGGKEYKEEENNFVCDINFINNLLDSENEYKLEINFLQNHYDITTNERAEIIDWIIELAEEFEYKRDTVYYAVYYIDRFLSYKKNIFKSELPLFGIVALSLAAKFEEIQIPKFEDYVKANENTFKVEDMIKMEQCLLKVYILIIKKRH
jgi:hypothetical protein